MLPFCSIKDVSGETASVFTVSDFAIVFLINHVARQLQKNGLTSKCNSGRRALKTSMGNMGSGMEKSIPGPATQVNKTASAFGGIKIPFIRRRLRWRVNSHKR
jgi:hypothetical protein